MTVLARGEGNLRETARQASSLYIPGTYDKDRLPQIVEYFAESPFWRKLFDSSGQPVNESTVRYYLGFIPYVQKFKAVEGCRTQCDFCDHLAPKEIHSAPYANFTTIIDEFRALRELGFVQYANPPSKVVFHSNGDTLQYHYFDPGSKTVKDAHDLLSYTNGSLLPQWQEEGQFNIMKLKTAGTHSPLARGALRKIVSDKQLDLILSYSFHQGSLLARMRPVRWIESTIEDFQILKPLLSQGRLELSIHSLSDETGKAPLPGDTIFHLEPQLVLLQEMLGNAGYSPDEIALALDPQTIINGMHPLHLSYMRAIAMPGVSVPHLLQDAPSYAQHIQWRQGKIVPNYPSNQVFVAVNTGEIFVNTSRYQRTDFDFPFDGLAQLPGRLGIPIDNGPSFFSTFARKLEPMEAYSPLLS